MPEMPSDMGNVSVPKADVSSSSQSNSAPDNVKDNKLVSDVGKSSGKSDGKSSDKSGSGKDFLKKSKGVGNALNKGNELLSDKTDEMTNGDSSETASEAMEQEEKNTQKQTRSLKKAFKMGMAMAPQVAAAGGLALVLYKLKSLLMGLMQALMALGQMIGSAFSSVFSAITSFISTVATALGVGFTAAATIVGGGTFVGVTAIVMSVVIVVNSGVATRDGSLVTSKPDCSTEVVSAVENVDVDARALQNAKKLYSCLHELGMPDINIAAVIGNFSVESGLDSTKVEGFYGNDEAYTIGERKTAVLSSTEAMNEYCNALFTSYNNSGVSYSSSGYLIDGTNYQCGIGMAQWTGTSAKPLLSKATSLNVDWWDFDFQMAYILSQPAPTSAAVFANGVAFWIDEFETVEEAALYFSEYYEGNTVNGQEDRVSKSEYYYDLIVSDWSLTTTEKLGNAILGFIKKLGTTVENAVATASTSDCVMPSKTSIAETGNGELGYPVTNLNITATYPSYSDGSYHSGIDFGVPVGTDVYAAADGTVVLSKDLNSSYGKYIIIKHSDTLYTLYAHNSERLVEVGDTVVRGERIAKSGASGHVTGPHVHFEVRTPTSDYDSCVDPLTYLTETTDDTTAA